MEKPNVDIEWYEDGFTMEEQVELSKAYFASRVKCKVTEQQKENWKDKMISDLKTKNAGNEEYIRELEEQIQQLQESNEVLLKEKQSLNLQLSAVMKKYSKDIKEYTQSEEFQQKYKNQIDELKKENKKLKQIKDDLIYKLCHNANV